MSTQALIEYSVVGAWFLLGCVAWIWTELWFLRRVRDDEFTNVKSVALACLASLPGSALLIEFFARWVVPTWTGHRPIPADELFSLRFACAWTLIGPLLLTASIVVRERELPQAPPNAMLASHFAFWVLSSAASLMFAAGV